MPSADERDTRGLISMAIISSFSSGLTANCTLHPPANFPMERIILDCHSTHLLISSIRKRHGRSNGNGVACMYAHRVKVLNGTNDIYIIIVITQKFQFKFFPASIALSIKHLMNRRSMQATDSALHQIHLLYVNKSSTRSTKCIRRT